MFFLLFIYNKNKMTYMNKLKILMDSLPLGFVAPIAIPLAMDQFGRCMAFMARSQLCLLDDLIGKDVNGNLHPSIQYIVSLICVAEVFAALNFLTYCYGSAPQLPAPVLQAAPVPQLPGLRRRQRQACERVGKFVPLRCSRKPRSIK
jgi:hypothetical protein